MSEKNQPPSELEESVLAAVGASSGHFRYESGHHGDVWLDLDRLLVDARRARGWASILSQRARVCRAEAVCGPLTGGAFVAQSVAADLGARFVFAERRVDVTESVRYLIPDSLRTSLRGSRVLLVDDAINAGSAILSTTAELSDLGAELVGLMSLLTLGGSAAKIAQRHRIPLFTLASLDRGLWTPEECPLCRSGKPLVDRRACP